MARPRRTPAITCATLLAAAGLAVATIPAASAAEALTPAWARAQHVSAHGSGLDTARLPVAFTRNDGQAPGGVRYLGQAQGVSIMFTRTGVTLDLARHADPGRSPRRVGAQVTLAFRHASPHPQITGAGRQPGTVNYFTGSNPARWHTRIPAYARIVYRGLWPGITATFTATAGVLRYAFTLVPGARASEIQLAYAGARHLAVTRSGALAITTAVGTLDDQAPATTQALAGHATRVASRYRLAGRNGFGFTVGRHSLAAALTIDPGLDYATYLGGTCSDNAEQVATNSAGDLYVLGSTCSADFPTTQGAYQASLPGQTSLFVTEFNPSGTGLVYSTFIGSPGDDVYNGGVSMTVDSAGDAYVTGLTNSADFPTTPGAYETAPSPLWVAGESFRLAGTYGVALKLGPSGSSLDYSTYLPFEPYGGFGSDIALAPGGKAIITGDTSSDMEPVTPGAYQATYPGGSQSGFAAELNAGGTGLAYATYLGAPITSQVLDAGNLSECFDNGIAVATDAQGAAYITGDCTGGFRTTARAYQASNGTSWADGLLLKLNPAGTRLDYATYYGTPASPLQVRPDGIAVSSSGDAYVVADVPPGAGPATPGAAQQTCTPSTAPGYQYCTWAAEFNPAGTGLVYATFFGGNNQNGEDGPSGIAIDASGNAYIAGYSQTQDIPTTPDAAFPQPGNFAAPFYLAVLSPQGGLLYATYLGGAGTVAVGGASGFLAGVPSIAPDPVGGNVYLGGTTNATNFPVTSGAFQLTNNAIGALDQTAWAAELTLPSLTAAAREGGYKIPRRRASTAPPARPMTAVALGP
jgi:hypothetical protein